MSHADPGTSNAEPRTSFPRPKAPTDSHVSDSEGESVGDKFEHLKDERNFEDAKRVAQTTTAEAQIDESEECK
jgi:hypothetical protein